MIEYHNECKKKSREYDFKKLEDKVKASEVDIEKSKQELAEFEIDKQKWQGIKKSLETHSSALNGEYENVKDEIFLNKLDIFKHEKKLNLIVVNRNMR